MSLETTIKVIYNPENYSDYSLFYNGEVIFGNSFEDVLAKLLSSEISKKLEQRPRISVDNNIDIESLFERHRMSSLPDDTDSIFVQEMIGLLNLNNKQILERIEEQLLINPVRIVEVTIHLLEGYGDDSTKDQRRKILEHIITQRNEFDIIDRASYELAFGFSHPDSLPYIQLAYEKHPVLKEDLELGIERILNL